MKRLILLFLLLPTLSFAADEPTVIGVAVAGLFSQVIYPFIGALLLTLLGMAIDVFRKKTGIQLSASTEEYLESLARRGISLAEEKGADLIKRNVGKLTGSEKFDVAVAHVITSANIRVSPAKAEVLVKSMLGQTYNAGATGETVVG